MGNEMICNSKYSRLHVLTLAFMFDVSAHLEFNVWSLKIKKAVVMKMDTLRDVLCTHFSSTIF